ncbi:GGDEF domain-containing protein [Pseudomonas sp. MAFF 302046]|uniref:diguanylate cyclase n=1 Tax=Pseudomonas morbosilactucae TaxID=2938197 RepID=A0ABT0JG67_9PSED|nr:GGDEF domain-containing protein [Pseudomonas morbosilactucae]MCK9814837.1 GGDEF domain-containing protein [Pseudomonas morbosilactucae]
MLLNDPVTLSLILIPFGLLTALVLCLSYFGLGSSGGALRWWLAGDLLLTAYRGVVLLQPGVLGDGYTWLGLLTPPQELVSGIALLLAAIGAHTLALEHLFGRRGGHGWPLDRVLLLPLVYTVGAVALLHSAYLLPWFFFIVLLSIGQQLRAAWALKQRYRGAWGLIAGHTALILFHASSLFSTLVDPVPPLAFDSPDLPSIGALVMDFMVSFLFTLSFALMLQEQLRQQAFQLSITDTLTGALNRRGAAPIINDQWSRARQLRTPLTLAMIDLDNFKRINDHHGHATGDAALQRFAASVFRLKRQGDVFVRWGGEEFLLMLPGTDVHQARQFLQQLREELQRQGQQPPLQMTFSAGLADVCALPAQWSFEALLGEVDKALYRAKQQRDRVEVVA